MRLPLLSMFCKPKTSTIKSQEPFEREVVYAPIKDPVLVIDDDTMQLMADGVTKEKRNGTQTAPSYPRFYEYTHEMKNARTGEVIGNLLDDPYEHRRFEVYDGIEAAKAAIAQRPGKYHLFSAPKHVCVRSVLDENC